MQPSRTVSSRPLFVTPARYLSTKQRTARPRYGRKPTCLPSQIDCESRFSLSHSRAVAHGSTMPRPMRWLRHRDAPHFQGNTWDVQYIGAAARCGGEPVILEMVPNRCTPSHPRQVMRTAGIRRDRGTQTAQRRSARTGKWLTRMLRASGREQGR